MIITIFDFDDTLFATSAFENEPTESLELTVSIDALLLKAAQMGEIIIVTNATTSWVELCLQRYLSKSEYLKMFIQRVYSTIDSIPDLKKDDQSRWKTRAFKKVLKPFFKNKESHTLFTFGDSKFDRDAAIKIKETYKNVAVKSVKLMQRPTLKVLLYEHYLLYTFLSNSMSSLSESEDVIYEASISGITQKSSSALFS